MEGYIVNKDSDGYYKWVMMVPKTQYTVKGTTDFSKKSQFLSYILLFSYSFVTQRSPESQNIVFLVTQVTKSECIEHFIKSRLFLGC